MWTNENIYQLLVDHNLVEPTMKALIEKQRTTEMKIGDATPDIQSSDKAWALWWAERITEMVVV